MAGSSVIDLYHEVRADAADNRGSLSPKSVVTVFSRHNGTANQWEVITMGNGPNEQSSDVHFVPVRIIILKDGCSSLCQKRYNGRFY
jgi:hypothetical protein